MRHEKEETIYEDALWVEGYLRSYCLRPGTSIVLTEEALYQSFMSYCMNKHFRTTMTSKMFMEALRKLKGFSVESVIQINKIIVD